ncbi:diguanylate cyclase [Zoogloea sp.]|uniref:sensor domain-containing diguanylate cyclase n=1 Tax=Zoogloea sp. TaxID=49181 RepID=UPI0014157868|nr:MAG: diguanylate cyclase [Zoogloea sp.]
MTVRTFGGFRTRLTLLLGGLSLVFGAVSTWYVDRYASERMTAARGQTLQEVTQAIAVAVETNLAEREREIVLLSKAPSIRQADFDNPAIRTFLDQVKSSYRHYAWMGIADAGGVVAVAAGRLLEGESVAPRPWFIAGQKAPFVGDVHGAVLLASKLPASSSREPLRLIDFAAPIVDQAGALKGVLAAHASWNWVTEVIAMALPASAAQDGIEAFVVSGKGEVLYPFAAIDHVSIPAVLQGGTSMLITRWGAEDYLVSSTAVRPVNEHQLGWRVVVRQPVSRALASITDLHRHLFGLGLLMAAVFVYLSYHLAGRFSQPLGDLARAARCVEQGEGPGVFAAPGGSNEIRDLSRSLRGMTDTLIAQRKALEDANLQLERKVEERTAELRQQKVLNESIVHASSNGLLLYEADGRCVLANEAAAEIIGAGIDALLAQNFHELPSWRTNGLHEAAMQAIGGKASQCLVSTQSTFGKAVDCLATLVPLQHDEKPMVLVLLKDVSELVEANRQLERLARRDALTAVHNRLAANEKLRGEFLRMKRTGKAYCVLLMDIDHFKRVNDCFGHETGDVVLKQVAGLLQESARASDFVARFGGEEFLVVLPDTPLEGGRVVAEKIRAGIAGAAFPMVGRVSLSIGLATSARDDMNEDDAVRRADAALYQAKEAGRNQVVAA